MLLQKESYIHQVTIPEWNITAKERESYNNLQWIISVSNDMGSCNTGSAKIMATKV